MPLEPLKEAIFKTLREKGPLTGGELLSLTGGEGFRLWRACRSLPEINQMSVARRYLRLDKRLSGLSRISPSIYREFLTYTIIGLRGSEGEMEDRTKTLSAHIEAVSKAKVNLAYEVMCAISERADFLLDKGMCVIIAGDIVYCMAHDVPRPERSTGRMVRGSDIDMVVVADDHVPERHLTRLDELIYQEKYRILITPHIREEIDYVVKDLNKVREQLGFDTFGRMLACKIMQEGTLLFGSEDLFNRIKTMLRKSGVTHRLEEMERLARDERKAAEERLMDIGFDELSPEERGLFYPSEESEEFE
jgi:hypothetical protein